MLGVRRKNTIEIEFQKQNKDLFKELGWKWRQGGGDVTFTMVNQHSNLKHAYQAIDTFNFDFINEFFLVHLFEPLGSIKAEGGLTLKDCSLLTRLREYVRDKGMVVNEEDVHELCMAAENIDLTIVDRAIADLDNIKDDPNWVRQAHAKLYEGGEPVPKPKKNKEGGGRRVTMDAPPAASASAAGGDGGGGRVEQADTPTPPPPPKKARASAAPTTTTTTTIKGAPMGGGLAAAPVGRGVGMVAAAAPAPAPARAPAPAPTAARQPLQEVTHQNQPVGAIDVEGFLKACVEAVTRATKVMAPGEARERHMKVLRQLIKREATAMKVIQDVAAVGNTDTAVLILVDDVVL